MSSRAATSVRVNLEGRTSEEDIRQLVSNPRLKVVQFSQPQSDSVWPMLNDLLFAARPEVCLRVYGFYNQVCDLAFCSRMTAVEHFKADCLRDAVGVEHVAAMLRLKTLGVGISHLQSFDFLNHLPTGLVELSLEATRSRKPDLSPLSRFTALRKLYLEGQTKGINVLSSLTSLEDLTLRSITLPNLDLLRPLSRLWSLDIKLGGTKNLGALEGLNNLKYLELWQITGVEDIGVVSTLEGLQFLFLHSLKRVAALPSMKRLGILRRIYLENMKGLMDISALLDAPALEELIHVDNRTLPVKTYLPLLKGGVLKRARVGFGSDKKNQSFAVLSQECGVQEYEHTNFVFA
jgi:hypothetical protein